MKNILLWLIKAYRYVISPWLGNHCRFYPSCSQYAIEAIEYHGAWRGLWLGVKRLLRCHPFHPGGYDPVPKEVKSSDENNYEL
jgi:putative membrane protein insertion efficiency factor